MKEHKCSSCIYCNAIIAFDLFGNKALVDCKLKENECKYEKANSAK